MTQKQGQYASTDWLRVILKIIIWDAAVMSAECVAATRPMCGWVFIFG